MGCFVHLNIWYLGLPFGLAQGGELVEPFRISIFGFRNYHKLHVFIPLLKNLVLWASCKSRYAGVRDIWLCRSLFEKEVRIQEAEYRISCLLSVQSKGYYSGMTGFGYLVADLIRTPERSDTEFSCFLYSVFWFLWFILYYRVPYRGIPVPGPLDPGIYAQYS